MPKIQHLHGIEILVSRERLDDQLQWVGDDPFVTNTSIFRRAAPKAALPTRS